MAFDASIPLQVQSAQAPANPLAVIGALSNLKETQARIALQNAQLQTANANTADIQQQTASRERTNQAYSRIADLMKDPEVAAQVGGGDISAFQRAGIDPKVINEVHQGVQGRIKDALAIDSDTQKKNAGYHEVIGKALDGLVATYGKDPEALKSNWLPTLNNLIAEGVLKKGTFPEQISGLEDIQRLAATNNFFQSANNTALARKEAQQKIDTQAAEVGKATAEADKFKQDVATAQANLPKVQADAEVARLDADFKKSHGGKSAAEVETGRHNQKTEAVQAGELGIKQKTFDATLGAGLGADGKPLSPEDFKRLAEQDPVAKAVAEYRIKGPPVQTRGGMVSPELKKILAINPAYDDTAFPSRNKTALDFSPAGASGKAITAADTALAHLNTLSEAGAALKNGDIQKLNQLANFLGAQTGSSAKGTYDTIVNMVAPEISKAVIGAAGGEHEREGTAVNYGSNLSDTQRESNIAATVGLLGARFDKQSHAYESEMGHPLPRTLSPESQAIRQKYTKGAGSPATGGGHVIELNGKHYQYKGSGDTADIKNYTEVSK